MAKNSSNNNKNTSNVTPKSTVFETKEPTVQQDIISNVVQSASKVMYMNLARAVSNRLSSDPTVTQRMVHSGILATAYAATTPGTGVNDIMRGLSFGMNAVAVEDLMATVQSAISDLSKADAQVFAEGSIPAGTTFTPEEDIKFSTAVDNKGAVATPEQKELLRSSSNALPMPANSDDAPASGKEKFEAAIGKDGDKADASSTPKAKAGRVICSNPACAAEVKASKAVVWVASDADSDEIKAFNGKKVCKNCFAKWVSLRREAASAAMENTKLNSALEKKLVELDETNIELAKKSAAFDTLDATIKVAQPEVAEVLKDSANDLKACVMKATAKVHSLEAAIADIRSKIK